MVNIDFIVFKFYQKGYFAMLASNFLVGKELNM